MLGPSFATVEGEDSSVMRLLGKVKEGDQAKEELLILLQQLGTQLLSNSLKQISQEVRLIPAAVKNDVELLKHFCSEGEKRVLKSVQYTSDYEFTNGCRTPPWRQVHGEICYLGISQKSEENACDRTSDVYKDLVTLLKSKSPHFAENINKQVGFDMEEQHLKQQDFAVKEEPPSTQKIQHVESVDTEEQGQPQRSYEHQENNVHEKARQQLVQNKPGVKKTIRPIFEMEEPREANEKKSKRSAANEKFAETEEKMQKKADFSVSSSPGRQYSHKTKTPGGGADDFSESSSESEEDEEQPERRPESNTDLPSEYWQIQKLVKYLKGGNQTATVIALCSIRDFNLAQETCQLAIRDIGSLKILKEIRCNSQIRRAIADLGGLQIMVKILDSPDKDLKYLATETIANVAKFRWARRTVRQHGGIKRLVDLLDCMPDSAALTEEQEKDVEVARCGALALWSCSKRTRNKEAINPQGRGNPSSGPPDQRSYRIAIQTEGMIEDLVKNLNCDNHELQMHCAIAIFKCAEDKRTRDLVRQYEGLQPLVTLLSQADNKQLLAATTGAIWKCSISMENVAKFQEYKALVVGLLTDQPEEVLVNVVRAQKPANRATIRKCGGIQPLVNLLTGTNQALLVNVTKAVGACATEQENMAYDH
ncbi:unnamed protein product [Coregonus sp. 'balchen']|nr:unnamed protein product [Coregonus sp. 'balchen']